MRQASGEPAVGAVVQVIAAEDAGKSSNIQTLRAVSDAGGTFEFVDVSPGRYLVGVDLVRGREGEGPVFPATFYPGTGHTASATVIELDGGEQRALEPILGRPSPVEAGGCRHQDGVRRHVLVPRPRGVELRGIGVLFD